VCMPERCTVRRQRLLQGTMSSAHLRVFENESNVRPGPILNPRMMLSMQADGLKRKVLRSLGLLSAGLTAAVSVSWRSRPRVLPVRELRECVSCAALATMRVPTRTPNRHAVLDSLGGGGYSGASRHMYARFDSSTSVVFLVEKHSNLKPP
jgi:hypothetical protein